MAEILPKSSFDEWIDGKTIHDVDVAKMRELLRVAINTVYNSIQSIAVNGITVKEEIFTNTAGKTVYDLTQGTYQPGTHALTVLVGGVPQDVGTSFTETSTTRFTLSEDPAGAEVKATYNTAAILVSTNHAITHEAGGIDELNITTLAGYDENIGTRIIDNEQSIKDIQTFSIMGVY